jgi:hypothetical protein
VTPSGGRRWAFRYQRNGIVKKMGFGSAKETGLKLSEAKDQMSLHAQEARHAPIR